MSKTRNMRQNVPLIKQELMDDPIKYSETNTKSSPIQITSLLVRIRQSILPWIKRPGVHTPTNMTAAGFEYTRGGDTARCKNCGLEVSNWTANMNPFTIHSKQKPDCPFIRRITTSSLSKHPSSSSLSTTTVRTTSTPNGQENPSKRLKTETIDLEQLSNTLSEADLLRQVRRRTFSHWPHRTIPSSVQMIEAGFFNCNVGDRVICLYCNLICQQWTPHTDDPCEVHRTLSPACKYVKAKLIRPSASSIIIVNESSTTAISNNHSPTSVNLDPLRSNEIVYTAACNPAYAELPKRHASFATWPHENLPPVDDLVRAGFYYTGTKTIVTCFYCNGSLQNWGSNDNPMIEHARWFPHCAYAKQLCGDEMYRKIQESERAQQERARVNEAKEKTNSGVTMNTNVTTNSGQLLIPDESTLSRLVAIRLAFRMSRSLLYQGFKLSIIKRCWEDQLRLKQDDFVSETDLYVACVTLQKQIELTDGKKEKIVIPSVRMRQIREENERQQAEILAQRPAAIKSTLRSATRSSSENTSTGIDARITTNDNQGITTDTLSDRDQSNGSAPSNPCVLCLTEEKRLACLPCGHLATCVPCGRSIRSCPICRREIDAFVRIYI